MTAPFDYRQCYTCHFVAYDLDTRSYKCMYKSGARIRHNAHAPTDCPDWTDTRDGKSDKVVTDIKLF